MYMIGICDGEVKVCDAVKEMLLKYGKENKVVFEISIYYSGEELCAELEQGKYPDILFLNVELSQARDIEVGNYIRNKLDNRSMQIVYISEGLSCTRQLFRAQPIDFLVKPIEMEQVCEALELADKILRKNKTVFEYWKGHVCFRVPLSEIIGFFSQGRKIVIRTVKGSIEYYGKMNEALARLPENFYSIHKSYVVNDDYIVRYTYEQVELSDGEILSISKANRKKIREKMLQRRAR